MGEGEKPECRSKQENADEERNEPKKHEDYIKIITALNRAADEQHAANDENTPKEKGKRCREIITIIGLYLAAFVAIVAILTTHRDSSGQIGALQEQLNADERPWVGAPIITPDNSSAQKVAFIQVFRNVGRTPTKGLYIDGKIIHGELDGWYSEVQSVCNTAVEAFRKSINPFAIIPGSDWSLDVAAMPTSKDRIFTIESLKKIGDPIIIGCVLYGSPFDTIIHKTGYMARIDIIGHDARIAFVYTVDAK